MQGVEGSSSFNDEQSGIVPRAVQMIFSSLEERQNLVGEHMKFSVMMSCFEIYIDTVNDLLNVQNSQNKATDLSKFKPMSIQV